jgi:hypothetical protein
MAEQHGFYDVVFLPWAPLDWDELGRELSIGKVVFRPYNPEMIDNEGATNFLRVYFNRYRDIYNRPVETITLCHYDPEHHGLLEPLSDEAIREIAAAVDLLTFCAIWEELRLRIEQSGGVLPPPNSETFEWYRQRFRRNDSGMPPVITIQTHGLKQVEEIEKLHFQMPLPAHYRGKIQLNLDMWGLLSQVFTEQMEPTLRERILRSLKWFRIANKQVQLPDRETQVVQIATALETLLQLPIGKKQQPLAKAVDEWVLAIAEDRAVKETRAGKNGSVIACTKAGGWAMDFYKLRNKIVHGDQYSEEELFYKLPEQCNVYGEPVVLSQLEIASFVYGALLIRLLERETSYIHPEALQAENLSEEERHVLNQLYKSSAWGIGQCLQKLGWMEPRRITTEALRHLRAQLIVFGSREDEEQLFSQIIIKERARMRMELPKEGEAKG